MANSKTSPTPGEVDSNDGAPSGTATPVIAVNGTEPDTSEAASPTGETTAEGAPKMSELSGIRYVGAADSRIISMEDLESLGVENPKGDLVWNGDNSKVVPTEEFNAATRDALLALPDFVVA